jgi:hypothetical protein
VIVAQSSAQGGAADAQRLGNAFRAQPGQISLEQHAQHASVVRDSGS